MNLRPLLFMAVIFGIFFAYMYFGAQYAKKKKAWENEHGLGVAELAERDANGAPKKARPVAAPAKLEAVKDGGAAAPGAVVPVGPVRPIRDESPGAFQSDDDGTIRYTANAQGITSVRLPAFKSALDKTRDLLLLPRVANEFANLALRVDLIENTDSSSEDLPDLARENWEFEQAGGGLTWRNQIDEAGEAGESALEITRELRSVPGKYYFDYYVTVTNKAAIPRSVQYTIYGPVAMSFETSRWGGLQILTGSTIANGPVEPTVEDVASLSGKRWEFSNRPAFVGLQDNYFVSVIAAITPEGAPSEILGKVGAELITDYVKLEELAAQEFGGRPLDDLLAQERAELEETAPKTARVSLQTRGFEIAPHATVTHHYAVYLGPRDNEKYAEFGRLNLEGTNSYGMALTTYLVNIFLGILSFFHGITGSWGLAIVCLTLVVRACLHPLNRKQQIGMARYQKKMAKVQPLIKVVQEEFKDDRMKMHQEMQKIFKENDANPAKMMAGCFIIFLQFPVWIGLITTLYYALDLRHAAFLWIEDLTKADHTFPLSTSIILLGSFINVLPFMYMVLMFLQMKMQPKPADPQAQSMQRMTMIMMMAFGIIFYDFPSGLMVYFITSTLFGLIESRMIKRIIAREGEAAGGGGGDGPSTPTGPLYSAPKGMQRKKPKKQKKMQL
jgi:YidC/Oxa1 family membrane protein insertase